MKKVFLLTGCLSLLTVAVVCVSCGKLFEDDDCSCEIKYAGITKTETISSSMAQDGYGAYSCSSLASKMNKEDYLGEARISCKKIPK